jgi:hypothetical protein
MTEPIVTSSELLPLFNLLFRQRFKVVGVFVAATLISYGLLLWIKIAKYDSMAVVMIKTPVIDYEFRIDPNPQVAPAYVDLAQADALLFDTHALAVEMHHLAEPLAKEYEIPQEIPVKERDAWLKRLRLDPEFTRKSTALSASLEEEWAKEFFCQPEFFLGLFEIEKETLDQVPLYIMKEAFTVKTNIAQQTNITLVNQPFLNFRVRWGSPGASAVFANLWTRLFVDRANRLAEEMGNSTEESILKESSKIEKEVERLKLHLAELQAKPEYQKMLEVQGLENALYGSRTQLDMFGYVELHADIGFQSGLVGELGKLELEQAKAEGVSGASGEGIPPQAEVSRLKGAVVSSQAKVNQIKERAQNLRKEIAPFVAEFKHTEFEINQRNRIMSERLTTATFSSTRLKSGYLAPPVSFGERAVPSKQSTGPGRSILALAIGVLFSILYTCWVIYRGFLVPVLGRN